MSTGCEADKAVDGNPGTIAQATNQYAWILEIDLGYVHNIKRVKTAFGVGAYATEYDIQISTTGSNFTTAKSVTGCTGGVNEQAFTPVNARYARIGTIQEHRLRTKVV